MASTPTESETSGLAGAPLQTGARCGIAVPADHQLPAHSADHGAGIRDIARMYAEMAAQALDVARRSAVCAWRRTRNGTTRTYSRTTRAAQDMAVRTRDRAVYLKREHPVRLLGIVAGTAFAAGIATRLWRSRGV